jgi:protein-S-isoprenylcysteine O-methyltransferase Ste14
VTAKGAKTSEEAALDDRATSGVKVPPPLFYLAGFGAGIALEIPFPIDRPPAVLTVIGAVICVGLWLALDGVAMISFRRAGTSMVPMNPTTALVTSGPYRFTRNPMYVGMAFLYAAFALAFGVIWALVVLPLVLIAVDRLVIAREEPYLEARFRDEYRDYKRRVRRWL